MLSELAGTDLCDRVATLLDHAHEFFLDIVTHILALFFVFRAKLCPNLNSEAALLTRLTFVQHSHPTKLITLLELSGHSLENQFLPQLLHYRYRRLKVDSEFTALLVNRIFPLGIDTVLEERKTVNTLLIVIDHVHIDSLRLLVVEEIVDVSMLQIDPCFRKRHHIVEPSRLPHRIIVILSLIVLPETPLGWKT